MLRLMNKNIIYAISTILTGLTIFFIYVIYANLDEPKNLVESSRVKQNVVLQCAEKARELGIKGVNIKRGSYQGLEIKQTVVKDPMDFAIKTSMLQESCKKLELTAYCLGNECKTRHDEPNFQFRMVLTAK